MFGTWDAVILDVGQTVFGVVLRLTNQDCYCRWIKKKSSESRKARFMEQQQHRLSRLAARKTRKNLSNLKAMKQSNSFVYVDYYGYRY